MVRSLSFSTITVAVLVGCISIDSFFRAPSCADQSRYYAGLDTSKTKGCWSMASAYKPDALCLFDSVLAHYQNWNGKGILQCSKYSPFGKTFRVGATVNLTLDLKTGAQTIDSSYSSNPFYDYTVVFGDTITTFDSHSDPNTCSTIGISIVGTRGISDASKAQIQRCDSVGFRTF